MNYQDILQNEENLDPTDWNEMRALGHRMIDDIMDLLQNIREKPVWLLVPAPAKENLDVALPVQPEGIEKAYQDFIDNVFPYPTGAIHPRFWSWVQGGGTPFGVLAELLAAGMNSNLAIGEHSAMYVEKQVISWCKEMLGYPIEASGILVSGGSIANFTALNVARNNIAGLDIRNKGIPNDTKLLIYCSTETHSCVQKGIESLGLGSESIRKIPVNENYEIRIDLLEESIKQDKTKGYYPFCIIANAGTVNTAAIDDLSAISKICKTENFWMHVDGAFGAIAAILPEYQDTFKALKEADSLAFDLHKWMYMPYEVGCVLIKNPESHIKAFSLTPDYLLAH